MTPIVQIKDIVMVSPKDLKAHPKNPNKHSQEQIERLAKIIEYQGWRYPIKVDKATGYVTSGHGRIEAAKIMGWDLVPVSYQEYKDEDQAYADVVSDNAIAEWSELDFANINNEIINFDPSFDIDLLGIKDFSLDPEPTKENKKKQSSCPHCGELI